MSLKNDDPAMVIVPATTYKPLSGVRASQKILALFHVPLATHLTKTWKTRSKLRSMEQCTKAGFPQRQCRLSRLAAPPRVAAQKCREVSRGDGKEKPGFTYLKRLAAPPRVTAQKGCEVHAVQRRQGKTVIFEREGQMPRGSRGRVAEKAGSPI